MQTGKILETLKARKTDLKHKKAFVGWDGFVDKISVAVDRRWGEGTRFSKIKTVRAFSQRIAAASSRNTNIEWYPVCEKMGGNGPLLANALLRSGVKVRYVGPIGIPPHPLFEDFARDTRAVSLGHPGETHALEFEDGKILFGYTHPMETVRYATILKTLGESGWVQTLQEADIVAFQNWTMVIHMTEIVSRMAETILPQLSPSKDREWFFDLADPQKRSPEDLRTLLGHLKSFESYGRTTLSLNRGEADRVGQVLHLPFPNSHDRTLDAWLYSVRKFLAIECVSLHHAVFSACATSEGIGRAESSKILHPVCLTGSGDHFNAGYLVGRLLGLKTEDCLRCGNAFAGTYIELGRTPELAEVEIFLKQQSYGSRGIDHVRGKRRVRENHANQPNGSAAGRPRPTRSGHP